MSISALTDLSGCTLALNKSLGLTASGNIVSAWLDQSGNGNSPTITHPPFYGGGMVDFGFADAANYQITQLDLPAGVPIDKQSFTAVLIGRLNGLGVAGTGGILFGFDSPGIFVQIHDNALQFPGTALADVTAFPTGPCVFVLRLSASAVQFQINGQTHTAAAASAGTRSGNACIGNSIAFASNQFCPFAADEIAFYSRSLTDPEVAEVVAYATANYTGIELAPTGRLIVDGDSIGFGLYGNGVGTGYSTINNGWASLLSLPAKAEAENIAIPSQTQQTCTANVSTRVTPLASGVTNFAVISEGGSNDLAAGRTAAQLYADQETYGTAVKGVGGKVGICTVLPRAGIEASRQSYRALLLADFTVATANPLIWLAGPGVTYADVLIDVGNDSTIGQSGDNTNTIYYEDGLHPTGQGHVIYMATVQAGLAHLFPASSRPTILYAPLGRQGIRTQLL